MVFKYNYILDKLLFSLNNNTYLSKFNGKTRKVFVYSSSKL